LLTVLGDRVVPGLQREGVGEAVQRLVDHAHVVSAALGPEARGGDVRAGEGGITPLVGGAGSGEELVDLAHVVSDTDTGDALERCAHQWFLPRRFRCPTVAARAAETVEAVGALTDRLRRGAAAGSAAAAAGAKRRGRRGGPWPGPPGAGPGWGGRGCREPPPAAR